MVLSRQSSCCIHLVQMCLPAPSLLVYNNPSVCMDPSQTDQDLGTVLSMIKMLLCRLYNTVRLFSIDLDLSVTTHCEVRQVPLQLGLLVLSSCPFDSSSCTTHDICCSCFEDNVFLNQSKNELLTVFSIHLLIYLVENLQLSVQLCNTVHGVNC